MSSDSYRCTVLFLVFFTQLSPSKCAASYYKATVPTEEVKLICRGKQQPALPARLVLGGTRSKGTVKKPHEENLSKTSGFARCRLRIQEVIGGIWGSVAHGTGWPNIIAELCPTALHPYKNRFSQHTQAARLFLWGSSLQSGWSDIIYNGELKWKRFGSCLQVQLEGFSDNEAFAWLTSVKNYLPVLIKENEINVAWQTIFTTNLNHTDTFLPGKSMSSWCSAQGSGSTLSLWPCKVSPQTTHLKREGMSTEDKDLEKAHKAFTTQWFPWLLCNPTMGKSGPTCTDISCGNRASFTTSLLGAVQRTVHLQISSYLGRNDPRFQDRLGNTR